MKIANIILAVIFVLFAVVQLNDPDPLLWVAIYGLVALISAFAALKKFNTTVILISMALCLLGSVYYFPGLIELFQEHEVADLTRKMKADKPFIEESRESLGLLIAFLALAFHYYQAKRIKKRAG
ncbi:transmembrane 220 family protein [Fulvivirgaceae bacterium BMA10]|uniref:Transmembrane 220 family protein n=1 Tax=Splendidivirga corallicola TaxID=3051826 RepID=A0ABT8KLG2_9BACT|nr:transmembrane 220 family protein [Fulvivirgaceae bacterium BMA10]